MARYTESLAKEKRQAPLPYCTLSPVCQAHLHAAIVVMVIIASPDNYWKLYVY